MKKHIPNFITCLNLFTGALGCLLILSHEVETAIYFVLVCSLFDFLDGLTARLLHVKSVMGKELDSLADVISFGLLPAFVMLRLLENQHTDYEYLPWLGLLVVVFSAWRLAKFNTDDNQTDQFLGLPTPANAIMLASIPYLPPGCTPGLWVLVLIIVSSCLLLVSRIPLVALKFKGVGWRANAQRYLVIIAVALMVVIFRVQAMPFVIPVYLVISIAGNFGTEKRVSKQQ